jgi:cobalt-zinc-cadmium efflux system outer membrane protein
MKKLLILALCCLPLAAHATELDYLESVKLALRENPDLMQLRYQEGAFSFRSRQALAPNSPSFTLAKNDLAGIAPLSTGATTVYTASMLFGFPGKAIFQSASIRHQAEASGAQAQAKEIEVITALSANFAALIQNKKLADFLAQEQERSTNLVSLTEKKYSLAQLSQVDVLNAKILLQNLKQEILQNQDEKQILLSQYRNILRRPEEAGLVPKLPGKVLVPELKFELPKLRALLAEHRPALKSAQLQADASSSALNGALLSPLPDFQLSASMNDYHIPSAQPITGVSRDYSVAITVTIPLFFPFNELNGIRAAKKDHETAYAQYESTRANSFAELETTYTRFEAAKRELDSLERFLLPSVRAGYELTIKSFSLGKADYLRVADARRNLIQAEKDKVQKELSMALLYIQLTQDVGCELGGNSDFFAC